MWVLGAEAILPGGVRLFQVARSPEWGAFPLILRSQMWPRDRGQAWPPGPEASVLYKPLGVPGCGSTPYSHQPCHGRAGDGAAVRV